MRGLFNIATRTCGGVGKTTRSSNHLCTTA